MELFVESVDAQRRCEEGRDVADVLLSEVAGVDVDDATIDDRRATLGHAHPWLDVDESFVGFENDPALGDDPIAVRVRAGALGGIGVSSGQAQGGIFREIGVVADLDDRCSRPRQLRERGFESGEPRREVEVLERRVRLTEPDHDRGRLERCDVVEGLGLPNRALRVRGESREDRDVGH